MSAIIKYKYKKKSAPVKTNRNGFLFCILQYAIFNIIRTFRKGYEQPVSLEEEPEVR